MMLSVSELHDFPGHPFQVLDDEEMEKLAESITQHGVLMPGLVRPRAAGGYEIVAGHRRKFASMKAGIREMPVIVRDMDDDTAVILMVDSNVQRENVLPSEKARAYKMKLDAMKRQGERTDLTSAGIRQKRRKQHRHFHRPSGSNVPARRGDCLNRTLLRSCGRKRRRPEIQEK